MVNKLLFRFTLPLTILSFFLFTKWTFGIVIDGTDEFLYGFPLIYKCRGFHTSLSTQYFVTEMMINLLCYFIFWFFISFVINRIWNIRIPIMISRLFWIGFGIFIMGFAILSYDLDDRYYFKRKFEIKKLDSGFTILGFHSKDRSKYHEAIQNWIAE